MKKGILFGIIALLVAILALSSCYTVQENQYACTFRFSEIVNTEGEAGLYFKIPFIDTVTYFPKATQFYDIPPSEVLTSDKQIHPESINQKEDIRFLKEKVDAGCEYLTTQMFFDNNLLYNFLYKIREAGITVPVVAGIMPITNANQVERAIKLSGSFMPQRFKSIVDRFRDNPDAMKQAGIAYATDQIIDLFANGIENVHVYSMNKPDVAESIQKNLSCILGI